MDSKSPELIAWELRAPIDPRLLKSRLVNPRNEESKSNPRLYYIDARTVMMRLDEVVGPDGWQSHMRQIGREVACELSVKMGDEWITKTDGAGETGLEGEKGQFSDAFKRAAVLFGIGRYLYYPGGHRLTKEEYEKRQPRPEAPPRTGRKAKNLQ